MINTRRIGNRDICDMVLKNFELFHQTGDERKYLGTDTFNLLRELTGRIMWKYDTSYMVGRSQEILDEIAGAIMLRAKRYHDSNRELVINSLYYYISRMAKNYIADRLAESYYTNYKGFNELVVLENIESYLESIPDFAPSNFNLSDPEMIMIFESEVKDLEAKVRYLLSQNNETAKITDLMVWPVIVAAFRDRTDYVKHFDRRTAMYLRYVIHSVRRLLHRKFITYKRILPQ